MKQITISLTIDELKALNGKIVIDLSDMLVTKPYTSDTQSLPKADSPDITICHFMEQVISTLPMTHKPRCTETYRTTLNSLRRFLQGKDVLLRDLNGTTIVSYERWLHQQGIKPNTSSFYMRILRAVYKRAVEQGLTIDRFPFTHVYTGIAHTVKRAINIETIRRLSALTLNNSCSFARDMFMFSFFTQGMAFVDMAYLKNSNIKNGTLTYQRQKTGQSISIKWTQPMQQIVDRYAKSTTNYLLPIIGKGRGTDRNKLRGCQFMVNNKLKELSIQLGLQPHITMYVARHSWASIARSINIPIEIISQGMGHNNEKTTQIYLKEIDAGRMAEANQRVINLL